MNRLEISGRLLARNTLINFIGQVVPLIVGVITIPFVVRGLGIERFGLLSLTWVVLGYFAIFDLGLGRATTKYVAEALGKGEEDEVPILLWTSVTVQVVLGIVGALVLIGITPLLVELILKIPVGLIGEAKGTLYLLALSFPAVLASGSFSGILEASQRFDLLNAVRIPSSACTFLLPVVGLLLGFRLPGIVVLILVSRVLSLSALIVCNFRTFPKLRNFSAHFAFLPHLLTYGGWVMLTNFLNPILIYLDRFLVASLLSMAAVAYYTVPYEIVTRLWIFPLSLIMVLFPAFSTLEGIGDQQKLGILFVRSIKYVLLALGPIVLILALFAKDALQLWLGIEFAAQSKLVMQILLLGVLINSLAHIPYWLLYGVGRPDIPAKFHLLELPLYFGIAWILISRWGIGGAALAWTLRVALDATLLFVAAFKVCQFSRRLLLSNGFATTCVTLLLLLGLAYGLKSLAEGLPVGGQIVLLLAPFGLFAWIAWKNLLEAPDREAFVKVVKLWQWSVGNL
jgi:O-antigen/teichoic acid export membrane protein